MRADSKGFLIADKPLEIGGLSRGLEVIHSDTSAILALLKASARAGLLRRQTIANPNASPDQKSGGVARATSKSLASVAASPRVSVAAPIRVYARDALGRFVSPVAAPMPMPTAAPIPAPTTSPLPALTAPQSLANIAPTAPLVASEPAGLVIPNAPALPAPVVPAAPSPPAPDLTPVTKAVNSLTRAQAAAHAEKESAAAKQGGVATRDSRGRFVGPTKAAGAVGHGGDDSGNGGHDEKEKPGFMERLKGLFGKAHAPDMGDIEKIDPTIEATKELSKIVSVPLAGVGSVGKAVVGRLGPKSVQNTAVAWYRKIFGVLTATRKDASAFHLAETRTLKDIDHKTGGGSTHAGGGLLGGAGGVLSSAGGMLSGALSKGGSLLAKGGGLLGALGKGAFKFGKVGMRRLPLLGALFAGGSALASAFGPGDPNKSDAENRKDRFTGVGRGVGSLVGGALGLIGGPVGAMIGGVIGDKVGELVGGWLAGVDWSAVGKEITGAWDTTVQFFKDTWKGVIDKFDSITKTVSDAWHGIVEGAKAFLKDKFGIDIHAITKKVGAVVAPVIDKGKEIAKAAMDKAKDLAAPVVDATKKGIQVAKDGAKAAVEATKDGAKAAVDYGKERVERMAEPIGRVADSAIDYGKGIFGKGSKGNKAALLAGMDNSGMTNVTERAMFMAQMDHESGGFRSLEESTKYKPKQFLKMFGKRAGIKTEAEAQAIIEKGPDATAEAMYGGDWGKKNLGNTQAGDAALFKGRGFTQLTGRANYTAAAKGTGLDLVNHPELAAEPANAAKIAVWFHRSRKGLVEASQNGDVLGATKKINGGTNGLDDRNRLFRQYLADTTIAPRQGVAAQKANTQVEPDTPLAAATGATFSGAPTGAAAIGVAAFSESSAARSGQAERLSGTEIVAARDTSPSAVAAAAPAASIPVVTSAVERVAPPPVVTAVAPSAPPRVSMPKVSVPTPPTVSPVVQASIPVPLNSEGPMQVRISNDEPIGQDLRDRRLAQVATGGIAA